MAENKEEIIHIGISSKKVGVGYFLLFSALSGYPVYTNIIHPSESNKEYNKLDNRMDYLEDAQESIKDKTNHRLTVIEINLQECIRKIRE